MVPRRILPHTDADFHTAQPLVGHPQSTPNPLSISATQCGTLGDLAPPHTVSSFPACSPVPLAAASTTAIGRIVTPLPCYATSCNHFETWNVGFMDTESESEAQRASTAYPAVPGAESLSWTGWRYSGSVPAASSACILGVLDSISPTQRRSCTSVAGTIYTC